MEGTHRADTMPDIHLDTSLQVITALQLRNIAIQPPALTLDENRSLTVFYERGGCWSVGQVQCIGCCRVAADACSHMTSRC